MLIPKSFMTGSYAYGTPTPESDIDLVVMVTEADLERLQKLADKDIDPRLQSEYDDQDARCLRFGKLNLLCATSEKSFEVWRDGTKELKKKSREEGPISRYNACSYLAWKRNKAGLGNKP